MSKSHAHFRSVAALPPLSESLSLAASGFPHLSLPVSHLNSVSRYRPLSPLSRLGSPLVSPCGMSDRFGLWFRRCEAGPISQVSVYSRRVVTPPVAARFEHLLHLNSDAFRLSHRVGVYVDLRRSSADSFI